jgi:hypothetical protein
MNEVKYLALYANDLDRKNFDAFIQGWCLSSSSYSVVFQYPRYQTTRIKLKEKMKTVKPETVDLLVKVFITNGLGRPGHPLLSMLRYLPPLTQQHLDWLWEAKLYDVLKEYYLGYELSNLRSLEEKEMFKKKCVEIHSMRPTDLVESHNLYPLRTITEQYVREVKTPEQFEFLLKFNNPEVTKQLIQNPECPLSILAACQDDIQYVPALLNNPKIPSEVALDLIQRFKVPVTDYKIANLLTLNGFGGKIVIDIRPATEEDIKNGLTLQQKLNWWNKR